MSLHSMDGLERPRLPRRRGVEPPAFTARAAGLYSEVVWDRSSTTVLRRQRPVASDADHKVSPGE